MIKYYIKKHRQLGCYILWKEIVSERGMGHFSLLHGTKKECQKKLNEIKGGE